MSIPEMFVKEHDVLKQYVGLELREKLKSVFDRRRRSYRQRKRAIERQLSKLRIELEEVETHIERVSSLEARYWTWRKANPTPEDRVWQAANRARRHEQASARAAGRARANLEYRREHAKITSKSIGMQVAAANNVALMALFDNNVINEHVYRYCSRKGLNPIEAVAIQNRPGVSKCEDYNALRRLLGN